MLLVFLVSLFGMIVLGVPVALALVGTGAFMSLASTGEVTHQVLAQGLYRGIDNFPLLAIPFFLLAGEIMNHGGISARIVKLSKVMIGHIRGGLGYTCIIANAIFAAITGSAVASVSALGGILIPVMADEGYSPEHTTAVACTSACLGPIIPPSIPMILYAVNANVSVMDMFLGGIIPGILIAIGLMIVWYFHSHKMNYAKTKRASWKEVASVVKEVSWALALPVLIMGGIISGVATPTESAVIAVAYALFVSMVIYRELKFSDLKGVFLSAGKSTAVTMFFVGGAMATSYMITTAHIPELLTNLILSISTNPYIVLLMLNILLLLIGCVMDVAPAVLILTPILVPLVKSLGIDPLFFGVLMCTNLVIGLLTPPVGAVLYIGCSISKLDVLRVVKTMLPYLGVMIGILFLMTYFGSIITFIPGLI